jgi:glycosyltransferase involved in cell wall biosynthesis
MNHKNSSPVNIIFIANGPPSWHLGGSSVFCDTVISMIGDSERTIYATHKYVGEEFKEYCENNRLRVLPIHTLRIRPGVVIGIPSIIYIAYLVKCLLTTGCNIYLFEINSPVSLLHKALKMAFWPNKQRLNIMLFPLGMIMSRKEEHSISGKIYNRVKLTIQSIGLCSAEVIHCQSVNEVDNVVRLKPSLASKIKLLPLTSRAALNYLQSSKSPRAELNSQPKSLPAQWLCLCRVTPEKGIHDTLKLLSKLKMTDPTCVVYGKAINIDYERMLRELSALEGIRLIRRAEFDSETRFDIYSSFDIMSLLPTVHEDSSLGTIEMILAGKKVIVNKNCLPPNYMSYPTQCFVLDERVESISQLLDWLVTPVSESCYESAVKTFTPAPSNLLF